MFLYFCYYYVGHTVPWGAIEKRDVSSPNCRDNSRCILLCFTPKTGPYRYIWHTEL